MTRPASTIAGALRAHWPNYVFEGIELGIFMMSAALFAIILSHPASAIASMIESEWLRRLLLGLAMGCTAVMLIYSPFGARSGAHMNPALTLTFLRLGKIAPVDAVCYVLAQLAGGTLGVAVIAALASEPIAHASVNYVVTTPRDGAWASLRSAWIGEFTISFILMSATLLFGNRRTTARFTGLICGTLVASFILIESPISGMSMNPARTYASAIIAQVWTGWWIYLTAPVLAMLAASEVYLALAGAGRVYCAKLHHSSRHRCIFNCEFDRMLSAPPERRTMRSAAPSSATVDAK